MHTTLFFFFSSRRRHTRLQGDWSSDVCSSDLLEKKLVDVLVAGPGMGKADSARKLLRAALAAPLPLVLDADALNLIAGSRALATSFTKRKAATILTPHPAEPARLLGVTTGKAQADRVASARTI